MKLALALLFPIACVALLCYEPRTAVPVAPVAPPEPSAPIRARRIGSNVLEMPKR